MYGEGACIDSSHLMMVNCFSFVFYFVSRFFCKLLQELRRAWRIREESVHISVNTFAFCTEDLAGSKGVTLVYLG